MLSPYGAVPGPYGYRDEPVHAESRPLGLYPTVEMSFGVTGIMPPSSPPSRIPPLTPLEYMWKFQNVIVHTEVHGIQRIRVDRYLSGSMFKGRKLTEAELTDEVNQGKTTITTDREKQKDRFLAFLDSRQPESRYRPRQATEVWEHGWFHASTIRPAGKVYYPRGQVTGPFMGKATPELLERLLILIDYYLNHAGTVRADFGTRPTLQEYADQFLGIDCNCLVGGYFQAAYPQFGTNPSTDIPAFKNKAGGVKRRDVSQLQPLDVLVREGERHVAVIQDIRPHPDRSGAMLGHIVQSASSLGGLSNEWFTIVNGSTTARGEAVKVGVQGYITFDYAVRYNFHMP